MIIACLASFPRNAYCRFADMKKRLISFTQVYVFEIDDDSANGENSGREKRKIGIALGVKNGIINFVFDVSSTMIKGRFMSAAASYAT